ncbi:putative MO25-like protein At5g47540 isoform X1 [Spinacia oleracea]|uniref:MO25-like protein At5g47540 n=1 Tax=Spinacia oleracea TaxID=3562 RepID=A0A9R0JMD8_SPIOL|nr:putative MO25-like protein At5g47540 isoform X1 [Spinacia oleracea]XP_056697272.1 putative MO25-like protein At5g47540 isoform X1 [Spinacia oleracea]
MPNFLKTILKFKSKLKSKSKKKIRTPGDKVRRVRELLILLNDNNNVDHGPNWVEEMKELGKYFADIKFTLYGTSEAEPVPEACAQVTQEFFQENTFRLLIICLSKLDLEARKDATQVVANLQRQQVHSRLIACEYLENNIDLIDVLVSGYEDHRLALHYGNMLRECIRHQTIAKYALETHLFKFFDYIQLPDFEISSDAAATFKELLTRHKSTVSEFLSKNYDGFFREFNTKLLQSAVYITKRQAIKLLGDILLDRSNSATMVRYVSSKDNLMILMNLLREPSRPIQLEAFHIFKLCVANKNKPHEITAILIANRSKLLRFFSNFTLDKEDQQFEADKAQVVKEIAELEPKEIR